MALWAGLSLAWLAQDRLVRDGDEEGHVGAAELLVQARVERGVGAFLGEAWVGDLGEYPPLFPALVAGWWNLSGGGQPGRLMVRGILLLAPLVMAGATGRIALLLSGGSRLAAAGAALFALLLPLGNGLGRHFMPEAPLAAAVALAVLAALEAARSPSVGRAALLGLACGAGLLLKQTWLLYAPVPVLVAGWRMGWRWLVAALVAAAVAGPWYLLHLDQQLDYGARSAVAEARPELWKMILYYPAALAWEGLGPPLAVAALLAALALGRDGRARVPAAWLGVGLVVLALLPKKYPRLLLPLLPAAAVWAGLALAQARRGGAWLAGWGAAAAAWLALASLRPLPPLPAQIDVDPNCPQRWLRPPQPDDLGLAAVAAAVRARGVEEVAVLAGPDIPCEVQTTHPWVEHLEPYLRREGLETLVHPVPPEPAPGAAVVDWSSPQPEVAVPALKGGFTIR